MAILRSIPRRRRGPSFRGRIMIDAVRGVLRVRRWPKKRGRPRSALQRFWVDWFRQANLLAKYADGASMARAIEMTKGSGMYPRDVLLKAMRGRLYAWSTPDGWRWYPVAAIQDISESLDVLAQTVGSVLVRATDRWRAPIAGAVDDVLTYKGPAASPVWQAAAGGGGVTQEQLPGTPIVPDNTVNNYVLAVTAYVSVEVLLDNVGMAASTVPIMQFSIDGGVTYKTGATDYTQLYVSPTVSGAVDIPYMFMSNSNSTTGHYVRTALTNLRADRLAFDGITARKGTGAIHRAGFVRFDGPITHLKISTLTGSNFNAGTIRAAGIKA